MGKWKYLGGDLGSTNHNDVPYVHSVDMSLGILTFQRFESKGLFAMPKNIYINTHEDLASIQVIDEKLSENKAAQGVLAASGFLLAGPLGILAGFAARKKDEVAFLLEVKDSADIRSEEARGKKIALLTRRKYYERILIYSGLGEKNIADMISSENRESDSPSVADEIEKLSSLKEKGLLSDEEFAAGKARLLGL